jgi:hypothetical protein
MSNVQRYRPLNGLELELTVTVTFPRPILGAHFHDRWIDDRAYVCLTSLTLTKYLLTKR